MPMGAPDPDSSAASPLTREERAAFGSWAEDYQRIKCVLGASGKRDDGTCLIEAFKQA